MSRERRFANRTPLSDLVRRTLILGWAMAACLIGTTAVRASTCHVAERPEYGLDFGQAAPSDGDRTRSGEGVIDTRPLGAQIDRLPCSADLPGPTNQPVTSSGGDLDADQIRRVQVPPPLVGRGEDRGRSLYRDPVSEGIERPPRRA